MHRVGTIGVMCILLAGFLCQKTDHVNAHTTGPTWADTDYKVYSIDPAIGSLIGLPSTVNVPDIIHGAAQRWNRASDFTLNRSYTYDGTGLIISARDFVASPPCPALGGGGSNAPAGVCFSSTGSPGIITSANLYLNSNPSIARWNVNGTMYEDAGLPRDVDVLTIVLHEVGHLFYLNHDCTFSAAVMCPQGNVAKQTLHEDDKRGITQEYGPWTSWEPDHTYGRQNAQFSNINVVGYTGGSNPGPELGPRIAELGVPMVSGGGSQYEMMSGTALANQSFVYFKLFPSENDTGPSRGIVPSFVKIREGMTLTWWQYNYQQKSMAIDFITTDGLTLRDSGIVDDNGVLLHPAARDNPIYPTGRWFRVAVDLTDTVMEGKYIKDWWIAYDNGGDGPPGQFRSYFDNLTLSCCHAHTFSRDSLYLPLLIGSEAASER